MDRWQAIFGWQQSQRVQAVESLRQGIVFQRQGLLEDLRWDRRVGREITGDQKDLLLCFVPEFLPGELEGAEQALLVSCGVDNIQLLEPLRLK